MRRAYNRGDWENARKYAMRIIDDSREEKLAKSVKLRSYWNQKDMLKLQVLINGVILILKIFAITIYRNPIIQFKYEMESRKNRIKFYSRWKCSVVKDATKLGPLDYA